MTVTRWPEDKITVMALTAVGLLVEQRAKTRMKMTIGLIARQRIPLALDGFNTLTE
jgi:hypothetical protein